MKDRIWLALIISPILLALVLVYYSKSKPVTQVSETTSSITEVKNSQETTMSPPPEENKDVKNYYADLETTAGNMRILLNAKDTPITANNFVKLAEKGFYNGTIFHRVIRDFMIQGGDPMGNGSGGPGYTFEDEVFEGEYVKGTVAMANSGPDTHGSQFFIMHRDNPLPKNYVIFGKVVEGMDTVDKIAEAEVAFGPMGEKSKPVNPVKIVSVKIVAVE